MIQMHDTSFFQSNFSFGKLQAATSLAMEPDCTCHMVGWNTISLGQKIHFSFFSCFLSAQFKLYLCSVRHLCGYKESICKEFRSAFLLARDESILLLFPPILSFQQPIVLHILLTIKLCQLKCTAIISPLNDCSIRVSQSALLYSNL